MNIPKIKNALENIKTTCENKMSILYPVNPPEDIITRYHQELTYLEHSEFLDDFELFRLLSNEASKCSTIITMRGTIMGSFIYYLLGNNCFNPLPAHYYCPKCGHYELVNTHLFGIDLPEKTCPDCGTPILADGYNIPLESVWGTDGKKLLSFDYNICSEFLPFARRVLERLYPENEIVPWGMFVFDSSNTPPKPSTSAIGVGLNGYAILPLGNTINDYPDLISYLENGDPCVTGGGWKLENNFLKPIHLYSLEYLEMLIKLQRATGIYVNDIYNKELRDITWNNLFSTTILNTAASNYFHELKPKTFKDMVNVESITHSTFTWQDGEYQNLREFEIMTSSNSFKKYPCFTREDFFDYLIDDGYDRNFAFDVSERIRKGHANSAKFKEDFFALQIPEEMKEVAKNYLYLFPRAHCVEYILIFARLAYYAKTDSRTFSKIVYRRK